MADFGLKAAKINNAKANADVEEADLQRLLYEIKTEISRLYFNLLKTTNKHGTILFNTVPRNSIESCEY